MSKTIKSIKTLKKHLGDTVHVVSYDGYGFDAKIVDNLRGNYTGLFTTDKAAETDRYWWDDNEGYCHIITKPYQLKTELKSLTLVEAKETTKKSFVSAEELKANKGHYCEMADGSTGFIAGSKYPNNVCVIHDSEGPSDGWSIRKFNDASEIKGVSKALIKKFSKGWHVCNDGEANQVKVVKILEEKSLTRSELLKGVGHFCELSDGSKGFICQTHAGNPRVLSNVKKAGWSYGPADYSGDNAPEDLKKTFSRAFNICGEADAKHVEVVKVLKEGVKKPRAKCKKALGVASIDPEETDFQATKSKKTTDTKKRKTVKYISCEEINNNIGKYCRLADGQIAFIARKENGSACLCFTEQSNGCGWSLCPEDVDEKYRATIADFRHGWCVVDNWDAEQIKVVEIFEDEPTIVTPEKDVKTAQSKKTVLDMTVRELLEKLNEIVIG